MQEKKVTMLIFGIIATIAVIGLVMMFAQQNQTTGLYGAAPHLYGGEIKSYGSDDYNTPYYAGGATKIVYDEKGIGHATRTEQIKGITYGKSIGQIPTYLQTEGWYGPMPMQEAMYMCPDNYEYVPGEGYYCKQFHK